MTKTCPYKFMEQTRETRACDEEKCGMWSTERNCCGRIIPAPQSTPIYYPYNAPSNRPDDVWYRHEVICKTEMK